MSLGKSSWWTAAALVFSCLVRAASGQIPDAPLTDEQRAFFEKKIRPVLVAECQACHSSEAGKKRNGGLAVDHRDGLRQGGDSGPALVPGDSVNSLLLKALSHQDPEFSMPPKKKLGEDVIRDLEAWIDMGAPDPREKSGAAGARGVDLEAGRAHWSFQPPRATAPPSVDPSDPRAADWPRTDVDRYVLSALLAKDLAPVADADRRTLLRRLTFDLTGLPPTPAEVEAFALGESESDYEAAVDRLLASPAFGEKWARHWLDVARYAESTGKTVNFSYPQAWRYRDYVIDAFNADKPYDQFIQEQLAGDLMPTDDPRVRAERLIATGFLAIGPKTLNERSGLQFELDVVDEQIDVTTQAFLGITAACARCHDHKFDPIPQADYYALAGIFRSTETCYGTVTFINARRTSDLLALPAEASSSNALEPLRDRDRQRLQEQIASVKASVEKMKDATQRFLASGQISLLQARLDAYEADGRPKQLAMGVRDKPARTPFSRRGRFGGFAGYTADGSTSIADSPVYVRGEADQPSDSRVPRGTLQVLSREPLSIPSSTSGRLELAQWIASRENPLAARVMVNRVWLQLFGKGLVPTAADFGFAGRPPTHPELLDHLAIRFMDEGWSVKKLIKYVVMSRVYQLGPTADRRGLEIDPDNTLLWRTTPRRLDAESLRDALLAVSGRLDAKRPAGSAVARSGEGPVQRPRLGGDSVSAAINDVRNTSRSIYLPIVRDNLPESMALFDAADPTLITADRPQTTVPSQGLYLLNNAFVIQAADATADQLFATKEPADRVRDAYVRCFARPPTADEERLARQFLDSYEAKAGAIRKGRDQRERDAWSAWCQALFASAEFQYRR